MLEVWTWTPPRNPDESHVSKLNSDFSFCCSSLLNISPWFDDANTTAPNWEQACVSPLVSPRWSLRVSVCKADAGRAVQSDRWQVSVAPVFRDNAATCRWNPGTAYLSAGPSRVSTPLSLPRIVASLLSWRTSVTCVNSVSLRFTRCLCRAAACVRRTSGLFQSREPPNEACCVMKPNVKAGTMLGSPNSLSLHKLNRSWPPRAPERRQSSRQRHRKHRRRKTDWSSRENIRVPLENDLNQYLLFI